MFATAKVLFSGDLGLIPDEDFFGPSIGLHVIQNVQAVPEGFSSSFRENPHRRLRSPGIIERINKNIERLASHILRFSQSI
jgi:hypothetical protein